MSNSTSQGIYSPLPQSLSDSDSEKEVSITTRPKFSERHAQNGIHENHHNGYIRQAVPTSEVRKAVPAMSLRRKLCFLFSIAACFGIIIGFLWVLPCSENDTCPVRVTNWENQHDGIELTGPVNTVKSAFRATHNLVLFFRRNLNSAESQNGVISVLGNNGVVAWYVTQVQTPSVLNCYLLDVNGDDINDCLVLGEMGLEAIDSVSGTVFWHAHNHSQSKVISGLDFPQRLPDLNHDNINELLTIKNFPTDSSKFVLISGKTGMLEGEVTVENCSEVHIEEMNSSSLVYSCINQNQSGYHVISVNEVLRKILNRIAVIKSRNINFNRKSVIGQVLNERRLKISNMGTCPHNCRVDITLIDENTDRSLISWPYRDSYAFTPVSFSFKATVANMKALRGHINGFILKLWQWVGERRRYGRAVPSTNASIYANSIQERVVLITFNSTSFHVINASLADVTQLCFLRDSFQADCQPGLANQEGSLLVSDLDMDGSQELVSYSSTFVRRSGTLESWPLISIMKVIRLEAELPKLYEVAK